ncbi:tapasin-related protein-like isoform X1 [Rhinichthys klamathensis goyatoka]|uniref:tapasin-related protein-like isoform X1 n=1 Tax=Rhinichthys klamathensis goyatoka TaxID=3034132 RepID=UPI0024B61C78|nr:tapasin-related protein-like isoform X1 [Rhinichthys klamathensis goyatoka]
MQKRMQFLKYEMISSKCNSVTTCALMLLSIFSVIGGHSEFNGISVQTVHRGKSVNISCKYKPSSDTKCFTVELKTNNKLCSLMKSNNSLIHHSCKEHIRFIPKTEEMSFEVSNLQINDTGTYICVVTRTIPPPSELLGEERTFVQVIAHPNVSVSHVRTSDGCHTILCLSEGFYPSAVEQVWMRNGGFQNVSLTYNINKTNPDESFTLHSYLNVSDCTNYSCWVNHSSLSQPMILHLPPPDCYENTGIKMWMTLVTCVLLILAILIITVVCERLRRARSQSVPPVGMSVTPTPVLYTHLHSETLYSTLGDHHPVPCSPVGSPLISTINTE